MSIHFWCSRCGAKTLDDEAAMLARVDGDEVFICPKCYEALVRFVKTKAPRDFKISVREVPIVPSTCYRCQFEMEAGNYCSVGTKWPCGIYQCRECKDSGVKVVYERDDLFGGALAKNWVPCGCGAPYDLEKFRYRVGV